MAQLIVTPASEFNSNPATWNFRARNGQGGFMKAGFYVNEAGQSTYKYCRSKAALDEFLKAPSFTMSESEPTDAYILADGAMPAKTAAHICPAIH